MFNKSNDVLIEVQQERAQINRFDIKLKVAVIALLAANTALGLLFPRGLISEAAAAESEYQIESRLVFQASSHPETNADWGRLNETELRRQEVRTSALESAQD